MFLIDRGLRSEFRFLKDTWPLWGVSLLPGIRGVLATLAAEFGTGTTGPDPRSARPDHRARSRSPGGTEAPTVPADMHKMEKLRSVGAPP